MATAPRRPLKIGLQLPHWELGIGGVTPRWADLLALARQAEAIGFDALWVVDHALTLDAEFYEVSAVPSRPSSPAKRRPGTGTAGRYCRPWLPPRAA